MRNTLYYGDNLTILREHVPVCGGEFIRSDGNEFDFPRGYSLKSGGKNLQRDGEQREMEL